VLVIVFAGLTAVAVAGAIIGALIGGAPQPPATGARADAPATTPGAAPPPRALPDPVASSPESAAPDSAEAAVEVPPAVGTLRIDSDVPGASVFVDRVYIGTTPVLAHGVTPGTHRLNVSAKGYDGFAETIEVVPGSHEIHVSLRTVRLDARVDVVHDHRMGSCEGRLVATPHGLRYETTNEDDAFRSPLTDLEVFEVDYLGRKLIVEPQAGKRYEFTHPDGDADRLFVFHRDVEGAAERLKRGDPPARP
jgi:hypothetical protein